MLFNFEGPRRKETVGQTPTKARYGLIAQQVSRARERCRWQKKRLSDGAAVEFIGESAYERQRNSGTARVLADSRHGRKEPCGKKANEVGSQTLK